MDNPTNEDAARILRGILNIGEPFRAENGHDSSLSRENDDESDRLKNEPAPGNNDYTESIDSYSEQESISISLDPVVQSIHFTGDEHQGSISVYGNDIHITTDLVDTRQPIAAGSNRVRINPVTNYDWESKYYNGNLLSVSSKYIAYALRGKAGFMLRILNRITVQKALIKGFTGSIEDMSFAHYNSDQLACIDSAGDVYVWIIMENNDKINYDLKLHIKRKNDKLPEPSAGNRLVWCPHVVDEDDNVSERILAVNVGRVAEVFDVDMINQAHGISVGVDDVLKGIVRVQHGHTKFISDIALAPDGSVLATASEDEKVKFWQLDFQLGDPPRCLHEWIPHEGQPVSRLLFCDNHLVQDDKSPFWRFLITGAKHNSELKIWCTVTWSCLQTIRFKPSASSLTLVSPPPLKLRASLDLSAHYLVLSDISRKVLYVFLLHQNVDEGKAHVTSVAHFILTQPLLSFVISEAKMFKASVRDSMDQNGDRQGNEEDDEGQEESEEAKPIPTIRIKLHCINPKAMQEMTVQYYPFTSIRPVTPSSVAASSMTNTEAGVQDGLSDVSGLDTSLTELEDVETRSEGTLTSKLIEPNAFATTMPKPFSQPGQDIPIEAVEAEVGSITTSLTSVTSMNNSVNIDPFLSKSQMSESEYSFKTCDDATLQEQPSGGSDSLHSWLANTSPLGLPVPASPDPAKVPLPAFNSEGHGANQTSQNDIPGITHSTPLRRRTPDLELHKDIDKTPTGEDEITTKEQDVLSSSPRVLPSETQESTENFHPSNEEFEESQKLMFAGGENGDKAKFGFVGRERFSQVDRVKQDLISFQSPTTEDQDQSNDDMARETQQKLPQRGQRRTNLTVTPRRQIDIQPDDTTGGQELTNNRAALDEIRSDVKQLRELLQHQQRDQNDKVVEVLREEVAILEGAISSKLESILGQHTAEQDQMFERFTRDKQTNEKQRHEKMTTSITTAVLNKVEKTVKNEIRNSVGSGFQKLVTPLQDQLNTVMTQKLTAADAVMKESIGKMVQDKSVLDAIGKAVCDAIQVSFSKTMVDFINNSMLPGFENVCRSMYAQINSAFENGTKQYIQNFETYAENRKDIEKQQKDSIVEQLQILVQNFQTASEKLSTSLSGSLLEIMQTQLTASMKRLQSSLLAQLQEDLNKSLQDTIQKEITTALMEQSNANEPRSQTQQRNVQVRVEELIHEQDFNGAFQEALTASDLNLVTLVCRSWDPAELLSKDPCPLEQSTLLSLIQQLSVDLSTDTELKHRYLDEALLVLDTDDPVTREHFPAILDAVCEQITITIQFLAQNDPTNPMKRSLKRLQMAAKSLLK